MLFVKTQRDPTFVNVRKVSNKLATENPVLVSISESNTVFEIFITSSYSSSSLLSSLTHSSSYETTSTEDNSFLFKQKINVN